MSRKVWETQAGKPALLGSSRAVFKISVRMNRLFENNVEPLTLEGGSIRLRTRPERINEADTTSASPSNLYSNSVCFPPKTQ